MKLESAATQSSSQASKATRDQIVVDHLPLVRAIAVRVHESLPVHVELEDLVHAGVLGLIDAASKYNPEKQVAFQSYAKHRIKGAILDSLRQQDWASRDLRKRQKQIESTTRDLTNKLGRTPTENEVADELGVSAERWRQMQMEMRNAGPVSASSHGPQHEEGMVPEFPAAADSQPDQICAQNQLKLVLRTAMQCLSERYQKVVFLYYTGEMTMKEIGDMLGVNESRVSQIHKTALEKMAAALHSAGIYSSAAF